MRKDLRTLVLGAALMAACASPHQRFLSTEVGLDGGADGAVDDGPVFRGFPKCFVDAGGGISETLSIDLNAQGFLDDRLPRAGLRLQEDGSGTLVFISTKWLYAAPIRDECIHTPTAIPVAFDEDEFVFGVDDAGNAFAAWTESDRTSEGVRWEHRLVGARYDAETETWSAPMRLSTTKAFPGSSVWVTDLDVAGSGDEFVVLWYQQGGDEAAGMYARHVKQGEVGPAVRLDDVHPIGSRLARVFGLSGGTFLVEHAHGPLMGQSLHTVFVRRVVGGAFDVFSSFMAEYRPKYDFSQPGLVLRAWDADVGVIKAREYFPDGPPGDELVFRTGDAPAVNVTASFLTASGVRFTAGSGVWVGDGGLFETVSEGVVSGPFAYEWRGRHDLLGAGPASVWAVQESGPAAFQRLHADGTTEPIISIQNYPVGDPFFARQGLNGGVFGVVDASVSSKGVFYFRIDLVRLYPGT
jgi:hypothetical protein